MFKNRSFDVEEKVFLQKKEEFLKEAEGKYVVINGTEVGGFFDSYGDAILEGYEVFKTVPFLIKQVLKEEPYFCVPMFITNDDA